MKEKVEKIKRFINKAEEAISRPFDITFALRRKKDPENPVLTVSLRGEISKKLLLFLSVIGALVTVAAVCKTVKAIKNLF
ncbi:MAG: hypothetical protein IJ002_07695 [Clostridia bacterium]|nr:hypothetical protein [Clostridia bacterium]